ncbi:glutathione hydrolase-like YwrD proenzyme [Rhopilema esculentum]|uniref:glutathione hydrolase-like YwrD proenzyme n=1 Tax=Rhopilema esculentum TaxID=499914 RepID=UPI0031E0B2AB
MFFANHAPFIAKQSQKLGHLLRSLNRSQRHSAIEGGWKTNMAARRSSNIREEPTPGLHYISRRSPVICTHGVAASSQSLASEIGLRILKAGGNAADAAVAVAAALNVVEPGSTGIGGDCFCLFYHAESKKVKAMNSSGRSPHRLSIDLLRKNFGISKASGQNALPHDSVHCITVPGAAAGWIGCVEKFGNGKLTLSKILQPAVDLAEEGFPVHPIAAHAWKSGEDLLKSWSKSYYPDLLIDGKAPSVGQIFKNPSLAETFRDIGTQGKKGFYEGRVAQAIVDIVQENGGLLTLEDLNSHFNTFEDPISTTYRGIEVWEIPPNGQGIVALMALNILEGFDLGGMEHNSAEYLHLLIEALQLAFADGLQYVADPEVSKVCTKQLLSKNYAEKRRALIHSQRAVKHYHFGDPNIGNDTVYFSVVDEDGNACSFINSIFMNFGSGLVPEGCGFALQNRGANFSLDPNHANCLEPGKRSYHTIIPGMATYSDTQELFSCFGVMGGFMQPQGHVQVLCNMIDFSMDPQTALDMPRFCVGTGHRSAVGSISIEQGIPEKVIEDLEKFGHVITGPVCGYDRSLFGKGQIIQQRKDKSGQIVLWAGSDPRGDGCAIGY